MSPWRFEWTERYAFGAGRVRLCAEPYRMPERPLGLWAGLREAAADQASTRQLFAAGPAAALGLVLCAAIALTLARDRRDTSTIDLVLFQPLPPQQITALSAPAAEIVRQPEVPTLAPEVRPPQPPPPPVKRAEPPPAAAKPEPPLRRW